MPVPVFADFEALNAHLLDSCRKRLVDRLRGHAGTIGERLEHDRAAFQKPLPAPYDACELTPGGVSSLSLVRYRRNDYSVPTAYGHSKVLVRGYVHEVVIACGAEVIARYPRSYEREDFVFNPLHYLALLEQKTNALDQAAPLEPAASQRSSTSGRFIARRAILLRERQAWTKSKCSQRQEFVVAGYVLSTVYSKARGSLVLGHLDGGKHIYAGRVGTVFSNKVAADLFCQLEGRII